jgi:hypothetical protein
MWVKPVAVADGSLPAGRQVAGKDNEFNVNIKISN